MFESTVATINSTRDALGLCGTVTGAGSLRGVSFLVYREQKQSGGRRIVKREYPLRDTGGANDLGRKLRERTFTAVVLGSNASTQRDALIDALEAAGSAELMHPEFGTQQVMVDSFECRSSADESGVYEFTITVYPAATDNAPQASADTASAVANQHDSLLGSLGDTLTGAWQVVQDGTAGATAVLNAITGVFDDVYDAVENIGVLSDVNQLLGALAAAKGSAQGMLNAPALLAASVLGALSGLSNICDASNAFRAYERLGIHLKKRQSTIDVTHIPDAAADNVALLFHAASTGTLAAQARAASGVLTQAIDAENSADITPRAPQLLADETAVSSVATVASVSGAIIPTASSTKVTSDTTGSVASSSWPLFESRSDIERVAVDVGAALDAAALAAADAGYVTDSLAITRLRLLTVQDLRQRGLRLATVTTVSLPRTEPALATLYRVTGSSQQWQRLARRNSIENPLFLPGGLDIEVIDE